MEGNEVNKDNPDNIAEDVKPAKKARRTRWGEIEPSSLQQIASIQESGNIESIMTGAQAPVAYSIPMGAPSTTPQSIAAAAAAASLVTSAPTRPSVGLNFNVLAAASAAKEALEKARKAALFQQKMREQLLALKASGLSVSPQTILSVSSKNLQLPRPLRLDKYGRELDEEGHVVPIKPQVHSTLKINLNRMKEEKKAAKEPSAPPTLPVAPAPAVESKWVDQSINARKPPKKRGLQFSESGMYIKREQQMFRQMEAKSLGIDISRLRREKKEVMKRNAARVSAMEKSKRLDEGIMDELDSDGEFNPNLIPLGDSAGWKVASKSWGDSFAIIEWWDEPFLDKQMTEDGEGQSRIKIKTDHLNHFIEHPVIQTDAVTKPTAVPMFLTMRERKKLRRRRRQENEREKQDKIRMGLIAPPPPKAKLANLMRVLGDAAVADPSKVERDVRNQMKERIALHEKQNEERKLTPAMRKKKKEAKWKQTDSEHRALLFRVDNLSNKKNLFKVDMNAKQLHLCGHCVICPDVTNIVVVEGGPRSIKRFKKLMLSRIRWDDPEGNFKDMENDEDIDDDAIQQNEKHCVLVWEGVVKKMLFTSWKVHPIKTESEARQLFKDADLEHYWTAVTENLSHVPS